MRRALIVVDFQNDFITGTLGFEKAVSLREPIRRRIEKAVSEHEDLIFTLDTHSASFYFDSCEGKRLPVMHCDRESMGWQLDESVREFAAKAFLIEKNTFGSLDLGEYLRKKNYDCIELCGLLCSICVMSNAAIAKAACPEARIVVDSRLTEDLDDSVKNRTLDALEAIHIDIIGRS